MLGCCCYLLCNDLSLWLRLGLFCYSNCLLLNILNLLLLLLNNLFYFPTFKFGRMYNCLSFVNLYLKLIRKSIKRSINQTRWTYRSLDLLFLNNRCLWRYNWRILLLLLDDYSLRLLDCSLLDNLILLLNLHNRRRLPYNPPLTAESRWWSQYPSVIMMLQEMDSPASHRRGDCCRSGLSLDTLRLEGKYRCIWSIIPTQWNSFSWLNGCLGF